MIIREMLGMVMHAHFDSWSTRHAFARKDDLDRGASRVVSSFSTELGSDGTTPCH